jgi:glycerophosphoryl diester phosphodiesterase
MAQARYYQDMLKKLIVAHRGVSSAAQENTIAAFQKAIAVGADMIEFDVRRTKDGVVIHHDEIAATFGELRAAAAKSGFELATLEETLTSTSGLIQLDVELKETGYESDVLKLLRVLNPSTVCITSFDPTCVRNFKLLDHHMRAGLLVAHGTEEDTLFPFGRCRTHSGRAFRVARR